MKLFRNIGLGLLALFATLGIVHSQTQYLPIPEGICASANQVLVAINANNVQCTSTLSGVTTISGVTSLTVGASGTALTQVRVYSPSLSSGSLAGSSCTERAFNVSGITTGDKLFSVKPELVSGGAEAKVQVLGVRHSGADAIRVTFCNHGTLSDIMPTGTFSIMAVRS